MRPDLAVDVGQSGMRVATAVGGAVERLWTGAGLTDRADPATALVRALETAAGELGARRVSTVAIGLTSVLGDQSRYAELAQDLLHRLDADRVLLTGDVVTAHAGALSGGPGVVLAAGTGAIALAVTETGATRQVDGWGHHFGDAGGGYWIGSRGLDAAMRAHDGRGAATALADRAAAVLGDLDGIAEAIYPRPDAVRLVAAFAREVLALAPSDETARAIVTEAAGQLAATIVAAARLWPPGSVVPVSYTGNLLADPTLSQALATRLPEAVSLRASLTDDTDGAALPTCPAATGLSSTLSLRAPLTDGTALPTGLGGTWLRNSTVSLRAPLTDGLGGAALLAGLGEPGRYTSLIRAMVTR